MIDIEHAKCDICGTCVGVCPVDAIFIDLSELHIENETCINCGACIQACPAEALWEAE